MFRLRSLMFVLLVTALPVGSASAASGGGDGPTFSKPFEGLATDAPFSRSGRSEVGRDGLSLVIVAPRGCGVAAHDTDGTTTCIGIPTERGR
jgi:hypothetical protein